MEAYFKRLDASCSNSSSSDDSKPDVKPDPYRRDSGFADSTASHDLKPDISQDLKPDINSGVTLHLGMCLSYFQEEPLSNMIDCFQMGYKTSQLLRVESLTQT